MKKHEDQIQLLIGNSSPLLEKFEHYDQREGKWTEIKAREDLYVALAENGDSYIAGDKFGKDRPVIVINFVNEGDTLWNKQKVRIAEIVLQALQDAEIYDSSKGSVEENLKDL
jgi:hypothetical protein